MKKDCKNPTWLLPAGVRMFLMDITEEEEQEEGELEPPDLEDKSFNVFETSSDTEYERPSIKQPPIEAEL